MGARNLKLPHAAVAMVMIVVLLAGFIVPAETVKAGKDENTDTLSAGAALVLGADTLSAGVALILDTELTIAEASGNVSEEQASAEPAAFAENTL